MTPILAQEVRPFRVLIVDDERANQQVLELMLSPEGYQLFTASNGAEALAFVADDPPDLILLDVMMPEMDGNEVTLRLKAGDSSRNIPVILVTALSDREARLRGLAAGAEDFLIKPVDRSELCVRVRNLLRLRAFGEQHANYSQQLEKDVAARTADLVKQGEMLELHAKAAIRNEQRMNFSLGSARMGIWELNLKSGELYWSDSLAMLFGLTPEQAPTDSEGLLQLIHPEDRRIVKDSIATVSKDSPDHDIEFRAVWADGSVHWLSGRGHTQHDDDGNPSSLLGVGMDIGDRKGLEAQFRQAQKMEAVGQLAGGIAHDFNNVLTSILNYSDFVIDTLDADDPRRADMNEVIKGGKRAALLTKQLLAFSRQQVLSPQAVDLNALILDLSPMLGNLIGSHIELVPLPTRDLVTVRADQGQLEQVLVNLVVNARDAMPEGGRLTIEAGVVVLDNTFEALLSIPPGRYAVLSVSDVGTGMTPEVKRRLFEPFFTTKAPDKGTGLGLSTVYGILRQSGGSIEVYSEIGHGTTIKVYLPLVEDELIAASAEEIEAPLSGESGTLLVVEDDAAVLMLTTTILRRAGYRVLSAGNPTEAETMFARFGDTIDLVITDIVMPVANGPAMLAHLRKDHPGLKGMFVSGYSSDSISHRGHLSEGDDFLQKPFSSLALRRMVRSILDRAN